MDIESRLRKLEAKYRNASSAADAAKANYLALAAESTATAPAVEAAKQRWQQFDGRKRTIAAQMGELEEMEDAGG